MLSATEKARAQLYEIQKQPDNRICMDCGARDPRWASLNLGIFICIKCAGAHRTLGTHISIPKSLDQDNWTMEQVDHMRKKGNANAKLYFEANIKPSDTWDKGTHKVVSETLALENYVRKKYEYLEFAPKKESPKLSSSGNVRPGRSATTSAPSSPNIVLPSYESTRKSKDDSGLLRFDSQSDLLTDDFRPRGEPINKADIMQLFDPKLKPTIAPPPKNIAPATPTYPTANYNVNLNANPFTPYNPAVLSPNISSLPYGNPIAPISPYGNPNLPSYANTIPAPTYGTPYSTLAQPGSYGSPASSYGSPASSYGSPSWGTPSRPSPDITPVLPPRTAAPVSSLPSFPPIHSTPPLAPIHSAPSYAPNPFTSPQNLQGYQNPQAYQSPQTYQNTPAHQIPRPNYGTPMPAGYAQPALPSYNEMDPNYLASQFNLR